MVDGYQKATCPDNVTAAFRRAGIRTGWSDRRQALIATVSRESATEVRHWQFTKAPIKCTAPERVGSGEGRETK
jgi:hypothetical protein